MAVYSIRDLEKLSGIKAHTLRIWEQRYKIIEPHRTNTNIRKYSDADLKFILNVALLRKNGIRIAKIAKMSQEEIAERVLAISEVNFEHDTQLDALTISMVEMDVYKFDKIISTNIDQIGFERTMIEVIAPFLDKLSVLWLTGSINPAQEQFMSCLIRQKIISAIDHIPLVKPTSAKKVVVYGPEGEDQELSLLFLHYLLKKRGFIVVYLGQNIPHNDLKTVHDIHQPDFMYAMVSTAFTLEPVQDYIDRLSSYFPDCILLFSGYLVISQIIEMRRNTRILETLGHTIQFFEENA
ncbi:MAG: MerR family transcriptional regulator [Bacteroidota bacterium]